MGLKEVGEEFSDIIIEYRKKLGNHLPQSKENRRKLRIVSKVLSSDKYLVHEL
jgi:hypothetical protein